MKAHQLASIDTELKETVNTKAYNDVVDGLEPQNPSDELYMYFYIFWKRFSTHPNFKYDNDPIE